MNTTMTSFYLLFVFIYVCQGVAVPKEKRNQHNQQVDTEAFLGEQEAAESKHLTPEESKRRLRYDTDFIESITTSPQLTVLCILIG